MPPAAVAKAKAKAKAEAKAKAKAKANAKAKAKAKAKAAGEARPGADDEDPGPSGSEGAQAIHTVQVQKLFTLWLGLSGIVPMMLAAWPHETVQQLGRTCRTTPQVGKTS